MSEIRSPTATVLAVRNPEAAILTPEGELETMSAGEARSRLPRSGILLAHAGFTGRRLGLESRWPRNAVLDTLELFAFVRPAAFTLPTPAGLAAVMGLERPKTAEDDVMAVHQVARLLLEELSRLDARQKPVAAGIASAMSQAGWPWGPAVMEVLNAGDETRTSRNPFNVTGRVRSWEDRAARGQPAAYPVAPDAARQRLSDIVGPRAESRVGQIDYAMRMTDAFAPREREGVPCVLLSEAGTGIGKTAGYLAPASLWAEANDGAVWVSTFTKNLQRQIDRELDAVYPDPTLKREKAVLRKGRENYLCLLNFEEEGRRALTGGADPVALGLVARWVLTTRDGDLMGGDFPGWLSDLLPRGAFGNLTDRRGECIYSACEYYRKCFIERTVRDARRADIVVANHALVMSQAAFGDLVGSPDEDGVTEARTRFVFDEGHHVFDAADSAFSATISGVDMAEQRRWIRGAEGSHSRSRGIEDRYGDLAAGIEDEAAAEAAVAHLQAARTAAAKFPGEGWAARLREEQPAGPAEALLHAVAGLTRARNPDEPGPFGLEALLHPVPDFLAEAAGTLRQTIDALAKLLAELAKAFTLRLEAETEILDTATRARVAAAARSLERRAKVMLPAWSAMLRTAETGIENDDVVDWIALEPVAPRVLDAAFHRNLVDPAEAFTRAVVERAHGIVITSATLLDREMDEAEDINWASAELRTGTRHLLNPAGRAVFPSPFDYAAHTRVLIVDDVARDNPGQIAAAYGALMTAGGGGALGLFTAIRRLRAVHERISPTLGEAGIPLYAQHVDEIDTASLIDIFRAGENACLLGTDAVRDGVDVPGRSLRLIVFDRVPWPRPDLVHKARRAAFGRVYDDLIARFRLKQAYGRLIRRAEDRGVFVLLDARTPTRLLTAFPPEVEVQRVGLAEAIARTREFLVE